MAGVKAWRAGRSAVPLGPLGQSEDGESGQEGEQEGETPHGARSLYSAVQSSPAWGAVPGAWLCSTQHPAVHCARRPVRQTFILAASHCQPARGWAAPAEILSLQNLDLHHSHYQLLCQETSFSQFQLRKLEFLKDLVIIKLFRIIKLI